MLNALRIWRDKRPQAPAIVAPAHASQPAAVAPARRTGAGGVVAQAAAAARRQAAESAPALDLRTCGPAKSDFIQALAQLLERDPLEAEVFHAIESYFTRHASPALLVTWEWESITASARLEEDENVRTLVRRSMVEAGLRLASLVMGQQLPGTSRLRVLDRIERAEWSVRRGDQTLFHTATQHDAKPKA